MARKFCLQLVVSATLFLSLLECLSIPDESKYKVKHIAVRSMENSYNWPRTGDTARLVALPLDKIGGGIVLRELKEEPDKTANSSAKKSYASGSSNLFGGIKFGTHDETPSLYDGEYPDSSENLDGFVKRNFDEIDRVGFRSMGKRNFDEIDRVGFRSMGKRNFDEIDRVGFRSMGKRNFDEIDRAGFGNIKKRNFDEIDRVGFKSMGKRDFDEIDRAGFRSIGKRNFDEIDRSGFRSIGKRSIQDSRYSAFNRKARSSGGI